jgi:hypothetical protein
MFFFVARRTDYLYVVDKFFAEPLIR